MKKLSSDEERIAAIDLGLSRFRWHDCGNRHFQNHRQSSSQSDPRYNLGRMPKQEKIIVEIMPGLRCPVDSVPPSLRGENCKIVQSNSDLSDDD